MPAQETGARARVAVDGVMLTGALVATAGYLLPWFKRADGYEWWYSGWAYASLSDGGGWTLLTFGWLAVGIVASVWARTGAPAAMTGLVAAIGSLVTAMAVVAASFATTGERDALNPVAQQPFGVGLPLLGLGLGLMVAGSCRAIVRTAHHAAP